MTALHPDLEALMPKVPFARVSDFIDHGSAAAWCGQDAEAFLFTTDQVRAAILGATERAAKLAAELAYDAAIKYANGREVDFEQEVAAAIRGERGEA